MLSWATVALPNGHRVARACLTLFSALILLWSLSFFPFFKSGFRGRTLAGEGHFGGHERLQRLCHLDSMLPHLALGVAVSEVLMRGREFELI